MSGRGRILARLAQAARGSGAADAIEAYLQRRPRGPVPTIGPGLREHFCAYAQRLGSDIVHVDTESAIPEAVARYLAGLGLTPRAVAWPEIAGLPWKAAGMKVEARAARGDDLVGITGVFAAIAETGTLMLLSGAATPAGVSLLPETHIAVVRGDQLVASMEDAWVRLRSRTPVPRAVNFVSGPSRTADVEQTIAVGAHGPRRVLILLVRD